MMKHLYILLLLVICSAGFLSCNNATTYDIVILNGRTIDPETNLDAIKNIGITGDKIEEITSADIVGKKTIDATGLVVSPGFIDLHIHGTTNKVHEYQVRDGVTTALNLETGMPYLREWLKGKSGNSIVNFGASVPHGHLRALAVPQYKPYLDDLLKIIKDEGVESPTVGKTLMGIMGRSGQHQLEDDEIERMKGFIDEALEAGALGVGVPVGYYPGASPKELYAVYEAAADKQVPIYSHTRGIGIAGIHEAIANALTTGAPLHLVHANSLSLKNINVTLGMVADAQEKGFDITTELYPYTAASTYLQSPLFNEGWREKLGIDYDGLQWIETGERLTASTFKEYREKGGIVIIHMMQPEWIVQGIQHPLTMIASDGMPYTPTSHPRTAGTFSRVLGKYVREQNVISLPEAIKKMTLMPAQRLEAVAPVMLQKGRMQVGADADITVFNPETIIDKATFEGLAFSEGVEYVFVNGQCVVKDGEGVKNIFPGKAIEGKYRK